MKNHRKFTHRWNEQSLTHWRTEQSLNIYKLPPWRTWIHTYTPLKRIFSKRRTLYCLFSLPTPPTFKKSFTFFILSYRKSFYFFLFLFQYGLYVFIPKYEILEFHRYGKIFFRSPKLAYIVFEPILHENILIKHQFNFFYFNLPFERRFQSISFLFSIRL